MSCHPHAPPYSISSTFPSLPPPFCPFTTVNSLRPRYCVLSPLLSLLFVQMHRTKGKRGGRGRRRGRGKGRREGFKGWEGRRGGGRGEGATAAIHRMCQFLGKHAPRALVDTIFLDYPAPLFCGHVHPSSGDEYQHEVWSVLWRKGWKKRGR